jgi:hypothetical protein
VVVHNLRRRGIDPFLDRAAVRRLVDDAVAGFGPLQRHLDVPEEILIYGRLPGWDG